MNKRGECEVVSMRMFIGANRPSVLCYPSSDGYFCDLGCIRVVAGMASVTSGPDRESLSVLKIIYTELNMCIIVST